LEAARAYGRVDVLAKKDAEQVAVEIETGKSDAVSNVKNDLLSGFSKVLVVVTDENAFRKVEGQLAKAGLLLKNRIRLVLRDDAASTNLEMGRRPLFHAFGMPERVAGVGRPLSQALDPRPGCLIFVVGDEKATCYAL
jgi:hypothetical protein